jgi:hypothetical protein
LPACLVGRRLVGLSVLHRLAALVRLPLVK